MSQKRSRNANPQGGAALTRLRRQLVAVQCPELAVPAHMPKHCQWPSRPEHLTIVAPDAHCAMAKRFPSVSFATMDLPTNHHLQFDSLVAPTFGGGMFNFLKSTILWKQTFDADFRLCMQFLGQFDCQALQERRRFWREKKGRARGLSPGEAVFRAIEEFADVYYEENNDRNDSNSEFEEMAHALKFAAPNVDEFGDYVEPRSFLSERWIMYLNAHRKHNPHHN